MSKMDEIYDFIARVSDDFLLFSVMEWNWKGLSEFLVCTKSESTPSQS